MKLIAQLDINAIQEHVSPENGQEADVLSNLIVLQNINVTLDLVFQENGQEVDVLLVPIVLIHSSVKTGPAYLEMV